MSLHKEENVAPKMHQKNMRKSEVEADAWLSCAGPLLISLKGNILTGGVDRLSTFLLRNCLVFAVKKKVVVINDRIQKNDAFADAHALPSFILNYHPLVAFLYNVADHCCTSDLLTSKNNKDI